MKMSFASLGLLVAILLNQGCATSSRDKTLQVMAAGLAAGALYGASQDGPKEANTLLWGGLMAAGAGVAGLYAYDNEGDLERLKEENRKFREFLSRDQGGPKISSSAQGRVGDKQSGRISEVFSKGDIKQSEIDEWVQDENNESIWYHKTMQVELIPPQIKAQ